MKNKKAIMIVGMFLLMLCSVGTFAQVTPPDFGGEDPNNVEDTTPISSLVALGVIAGAAYGIKENEKR
jgi:hypothetical protein